MSKSTGNSSKIRAARKELMICVDAANYLDNGNAGQEWEGSNIVFDKIGYDKVSRIFSVLCSVHGIQSNAVPLAESLKPHEKLSLRFDADQVNVFTQNQRLIGHLVNASWMDPMRILLAENAAQISLCEVDYMKTRAQRGPRTRVPLLAIRIEFKLSELKNHQPAGGKHGCILLHLGGDQLKIWAQKLTVSYLNLPLETARLVFELYNRMNDEYEKDPEEHPGYAGLDNLDKEIMTARRRMKASIRGGLSYASEIETEDFAEYMRKMCERESDRYAAVKPLIPEYASNPAEVLSEHADEENCYCWWNLTRIDEEAFADVCDGYSHWYDICELYGSDPLPFDLEDPDIVSIFGFDQFQAFADLSYGC